MTLHSLWRRRPASILTRSSNEGDPSERFDEPGLVRMGINQAEVPLWGMGPMVSRLPGQSLSWRTCELRPRPQKEEQTRWRQRWDPFGMCSWPPEDDRIESFHRHVRDQAKALIGADLARTEKFTTSVRDGIDIRETLRNWHKGELYVKVVPPSRGSIDTVVFLFDLPADPELYTNRTTWYAEHAEESTLAFYATDPMKNLVGPGIAQAQYRWRPLHLSAPSHPGRLGRPAFRLHRHLGGTATRRGFLAQPGPACRGCQPENPTGRLEAVGPKIWPQDRPSATEAIQWPAPRTPAHIPRAERQADSVLCG